MECTRVQLKTIHKSVQVLKLNMNKVVYSQDVLWKDVLLYMVSIWVSHNKSGIWLNSVSMEFNPTV